VEPRKSSTVVYSSLKVKNMIGNTLAYVVLVTMSFLFLIPFLYMVGTSFKEYEDIISRPMNPIPLDPTLQNFVHLFEKLPIWIQFSNSMIIAVSVTVLAIVFNSIVAFGFARYEFKYKNLLFIAVLSTMMIPPQLTLVPSFMMFRSWGWLDTFFPLIFPTAIQAFGIFFIRQVMTSIPRELYDSARIDGCSELGTFFRIAMPLAKSAIGVVAIMTFMGAWNDYLGPLIYLTSDSKMTLAVGLTTMSNPYSIDFASPITGAFFMSIPIIIMLCVVGQKYFVDGLTAGSIKG